MKRDRQAYLQRLSTLETERSSWLSHWQELSRFIQPRRARFLLSDRNRGDRRDSDIINGTARRAVRILSSGMMAGITSPARPWFRLTTPDAGLSESSNVRSWLHAVEERLRIAFARSNVYNSLHGVYEDLGQFGTSALLVGEDAEDGLRGYNLPIGQYALATSERGAVDTVYRKFSMTVAQLVRKFGREACSERVRTAFERGQFDTWMEVLHVIEPNFDMKHGKAGPAGMAFRSAWMEVSGDATTGFLREGGFEEFPVMAPRWDVIGEDAYGSSPGMDALGDTKALQLLERRKAQAVDKVVNPPMRAPSSLLNGRASLLPGDVTYVDVVQGGQQFAPAQEVPPAAIAVFGEEIRRHESRINAAFYADLWLMLAEGAGGQMTAREVAERHEEKMLQLGPVLERLQDELLDPLIDRAFSVLFRGGQLPPPPPELQGMKLRVEYISVLAQAQKLLGTASVERLASFAGSLAAARPDVLDKLNVDAMVEEYAAMLGTKPDLLVPSDVVEAKRAERARAAQMQQAAAAAQATVQGAKTLSETDMGSDNALARMLGAMGGPASSLVGNS